MAAMETALGLLGILAFIVVTIAVAAAVTFGVVKVLPAREPARGDTSD